MKREFLLNIIILLTINLLVKPLYLFGVDAHIQNIVGPQTYGVYLALFNMVFLFQFIIEPGIQTYNSRLIAKEPEKLGYHLPRILGLKLVLFLLFILAVVVGFYVWGYESDLLRLTLFIGVNLFLSTTYIYLRTNIAAIGRYRLDSFLSAWDKIVMLGILGYISWVPPYCEQFEIIWLVYGQMAAYSIACITALMILSYHLTGISVIFSWTYAKQLFRWSFPFILILLFMTIYNKIDVIMLERMLGDDGLEAGIYAAGYRFVDALNMLGYLVAALLLPMYSSNIKNSKVLTELLYMGLKLMVVLAVIAAVAFIMYGSYIMFAVYDDATSYYSQVLTVLMISFLGVSIAYMYGTLLVADDHLRVFNTLLAVSVIVNILLNFWLIPLYSAKGAALATAITQIAVMIGQVWLVHRYTSVRFQPVVYLRVLGFALICTLIFYTLSLTGLIWYYQLALSISFSVILSFILKLVDVREVLEILKKRPTT